MPADTMSTQMQLKGYKDPIVCTRAILAANGVKGLYAGFVPFLLQSSAKSSIRFFAFEAISQHLMAGADAVQIYIQESNFINGTSYTVAFTLLG
jgi:hypothetical protein